MRLLLQPVLQVVKAAHHSTEDEVEDPTQVCQATSSRNRVVLLVKWD